MSVLVQKLRLSRLWFALLDQVQYHDRGPISRKEVVKVSCSSGEEWIDDADWNTCGSQLEKTLLKKKNKLSRRARTFNGRPWGHVVLLLHPVDRDAPAILNKVLNAVLNHLGSPPYSPEHNSCIVGSGAWARHHRSIFAGDNKKG
jgi:hypothetical protein